VVMGTLWVSCWFSDDVERRQVMMKRRIRPRKFHARAKSVKKRPVRENHSVQVEWRGFPVAVRMVPTSFMKYNVKTAMLSRIQRPATRRMPQWNAPRVSME